MTVGYMNYKPIYPKNASNKVFEVCTYYYNFFLRLRYKSEEISQCGNSNQRHSKYSLNSTESMKNYNITVL